MPTLVQVMLEVARTIGFVYEGTSTSVTTSSLTDTGLEVAADHYVGGTLWILSGTQQNGQCVKVRTHDGNTVTFTALSGTFTTNVSYALATADYTKLQLKQAVLDALRYEETLMKNDTLTVIANTEQYTLPTGVENVYAIQIAKNESEPYVFTEHYYWHEYDGKLIFSPGRQPLQEDRIIRLWYLGSHGEIAETGSIEPTISMRWLIWKSIETLYRRNYMYLVKNAPEQIELLNEAKENVKYAESMADKYDIKIGNPQPRLANY